MREGRKGEQGEEGDLEGHGARRVAGTIATLEACDVHEHLAVRSSTRRVDGVREDQREGIQEGGWVEKCRGREEINERCKSNWWDRMSLYDTWMVGSKMSACPRSE